jgi:hypothetical protein
MIMDLLNACSKKVTLNGYEDDWSDQCSSEVEMVRKFDNADPERKDKKTTRIAFIKTHKTGGSVVQNVLLRFGDTNNLVFVIPPSYHAMFPNRTTPKWLLPCKSQKPDILCIHTWIGLERAIGLVKANPFVFTIIRHPHDVLESFFR